MFLKSIFIEKNVVFLFTNFETFYHLHNQLFNIFIKYLIKM